jgi:enoyl-CoA hydratase/carnithine racemase
MGLFLNVGLFPDAGGSYYLTRLPNNLGIFLGLTGHRLHGMDVVHAGMANHFIPTNRVFSLFTYLLDCCI